MKKVAIVILNYLNYHDTIECLNSLKKDKYQNKEIIVVDNASNNGSKEALESYIMNDKGGIHLLLSERNEGFARGNNKGILFARNRLKCEFILIVNNDTIFIDENMINKLLKTYEKGVGIIGPRIISQNGYEQNPAENMIFDVENINFGNAKWKQIKNLLKYIKLFYVLKYIKLILKNNLKVLQYNFIKQKTSTNLVLHGSCMMLTPDYFCFYPCLLPETFLYYEENILTILTDKVKLNKVFTSETKIYHKEDQSSLLSFNNDKKIMNEYAVSSRKIACELLDMNYNQISKKFFAINYKNNNL